MRVVQVSALSNGVRVVSEHIPQSGTISLGAWVAAGGRCEIEKNNGISHFLEHMAFKGTTTRTAKQIAEEIERVGGYLNAYTAREETAYYARLLKEDWKVGIAIIADILINPTFCKEELERERRVILQEIGRAQDDPDDIVFDHFQNVAYPDQPMGRSILGPQNIVSSLSAEDLRAYRNHLYRGPHLVFSAAGNVDHEALVQAASQAFGEVAASASGHTSVSARYTGGIFADTRPLEQVHIILGVESVSFEDPEYYVAALFNAILGRGMSSRLFQEVREKRGLVYSVYGFGTAYKDSGLMGIYAGTSAEKCTELVQVVRDECLKMADGVTDEEMRRALAQFKSSLMMAAESTSAMCEQNASHMLVYGRPISREEMIAKVEAITKTQIAQFTERLFRGKALALATVGPITQEEAHVLADSFRC
ncbi:MAG: insulinase family protein [Holosporales bacterium]|jgi:predicted Zn-dependent peptidase|nr:insulinase family protein [Holosporales bacterium]